MPVLSITSWTAPWRAPPSEVKSFWYSIRTTAVCWGSTGTGGSLGLRAGRTPTLALSVCGRERPDDPAHHLARGVGRRAAHGPRQRPVADRRGVHPLLHGAPGGGHRRPPLRRPGRPAAARGRPRAAGRSPALRARDRRRRRVPPHLRDDPRRR